MSYNKGMKCSICGWYTFSQDQNKQLSEFSYHVAVDCEGRIAQPTIHQEAFNFEQKIIKEIKR